jgi:hypothetical protein
LTTGRTPEKDERQDQSTDEYDAERSFIPQARANRPAITATVIIHRRVAIGGSRMALTWQLWSLLVSFHFPLDVSPETMDQEPPFRVAD